jgi:hypothetical protein
VRILLVSQMYPGPDAPDLGVFVAQLERALLERGHEIERAVLDSRAGGKRRYLTLARRTRRAARRFRPDVVYAHFLVPTGLVAGLASSAPLVVTAHGRDVRNVGEIRGVAALTRRTIRRAATVIAVSDYLRRELEAKVPEAVGKTQVIDSGVDLERFTVEPAPDSGPRFLCIGALTERKNVVRLATPSSAWGRGRSPFLGDGELRVASRGGPTSSLRAQSRTTRSRRGSRTPTWSASRAWSSPSARRRWKEWPAAAPWSRRRSAGHPSSCRPRPVCSSTRSTSRP